MPNNFDQNFQEQQPNQLNQQEAFQNQQRWGWQCPPCPPCRCDCRQCWGWNWNRPWDGQWDGRGPGQMPGQGQRPGQGPGQRPGQGNQPPRR